jgi:hypothetical protein
VASFSMIKCHLPISHHLAGVTEHPPPTPPPPHPLNPPPMSGGSVANCYNDLWVLDLSTGAWTKPEVVGGSPTPRAGHGGALVGDSWYILGGGNNVKGGLTGWAPVWGALGLAVLPQQVHLGYAMGSEGWVDC